MIRITRPTPDVVRHFGERIADLDPTYPAAGEFREFELTETVGHGVKSFDAGKEALESWCMHTEAGVTVEPVPLAIDQTPVLFTRALGVWLLFACRISTVVNEQSQFGFTYATLPGHPEQGEETFMLNHASDSSVALTITARSRPGTMISRVSGPIATTLQRRYTERYFNAMTTCIASRL